MKTIFVCLVLLALATPSASFDIAEIGKVTRRNAIGWADPYQYQSCKMYANNLPDYIYSATTSLLTFKFTDAYSTLYYSIFS